MNKKAILRPRLKWHRRCITSILLPAHSYSRDENPGYLVAEKMLAELEGATSALLFSSGMAAKLREFCVT